MRITGGENPLDATSVHPESYEAAEKLLAMHHPLYASMPTPLRLCGRLTVSHKSVTGVV